MQDDRWPQHCRSLLVASVNSAASAFPTGENQAPKRIHDARKTLKQARAIARLFVPGLGEPARVTIAALATARRRMAQARDLDVMEQRLKRLDPPEAISEAVTLAIGRERTAVKRGARGGFGASASRIQLSAIARRLEAWDIGGLRDRDIVEAVARTYRQARQRGRRAFKGGDPAALHRLRARVVDLLYQLAALSPAWPAALTAQGDELNELRDTLGDFNDLTVLAAFASTRAGLSPGAMAALTERLEARQKKLRRRARVEFDRLFAEAPEAFADRIAAYLKRPMAKPEISGDKPAAGRKGQ